MVAPGKNLEFEDLPEFERRCRLMPGLRKKIIEEIENRPTRAEIVFGHIKKIEIEFEDRIFIAYFGRNRNHVGLIHAFDRNRDSAMQADYEQELLEHYSK